MEVHLKVQKARMDAGMNQTAFAKKLGLSQNDVWRMENGEKKFISRAYINFMLEQGYDLNSLFDDNLDLQKSKHEAAFKLKDNDDNVSIKINEEDYLPVFPDNYLNNFTHLLYHQEETLPTDYLHIPNLPDNNGAVRVQCDSMYPILKPKDIIIFKKHTVKLEDIFYGEIYLMSLKLSNQEVVILKRLQPADCDGECVKLVSENPKYQSKDIPIERIQALALVKATIVINSTITWKQN